MDFTSYPTDPEAVAQRRMPGDLQSSQTKLVYYYLRVTDCETVGDLSAELDMKRMTLYDVLDTLDEKGLVRREGERYRTA
ncbi:helix-turn-helix domain-containing protein [Halostella sp. PRR32]|uniref:helix-turn-helix domain-containing protein n=1 Tax=Halostella sp. PRR32 TaxID=3098147 RepID=UPI002B1E5ED8|nr:helix-turn-helix domain-containing protein [Halostella sp. PRR32]